jgi:hypothetical protein
VALAAAAKAPNCFQCDVAGHIFLVHIIAVCILLVLLLGSDGSRLGLGGLGCRRLAWHGGFLGRELPLLPYLPPVQCLHHHDTYSKYYGCTYSGLQQAAALQGPPEVQCRVQRASAAVT